MKRTENHLLLAATDLANHVVCRHLTSLDLAAAEGRLEPPSRRRPEVELLRERGLQHERAYLDHLSHQGLAITRLDDVGEPGAALGRTLEAMRSGADVIVQPTLAHGRWHGRADILRRVERQSALGGWSYEVYDTKLSRETRGGTILQLCLYSDLVGELQGRLPESMHVVTPGRGLEPQSHRVQDFLAYYRLVQRQLLRAVDGVGDVSGAVDARVATYPDPVPHCDVCRWWPACDRRRRADDHLCLVAGISKLQTRELQSRGVATLESLATVALPLSFAPRRGAKDSYVRVREQARVQLDGRRRQGPVHELLPVEAGRGCARLPAPSPGDVFLDLEGDPYLGEGGLEYLFGFAVRGERGDAVYRCDWAYHATQEKAAFERFVDTVMERWARDPDLHVYHFAPYEPAALKRLMSRHATREGEIDRMLRAGLFVDLYGVVRQALRASVERYSIKDLEVFYGFQRQQALDQASASLRAVEWALELGDPAELTTEIRRVIEAYNRDDCVSAMRLREWLEGLRAELEAKGEHVPRPAQVSGAPSESLDERERRVRELMEHLAGDVPLEHAQRTEEEQQARRLLAHLLGWHRREDKAPWWEYFRLRELSDEELLEERAALAGLSFDSHVGGTPRGPVHRYLYPRQETSLRKGDELHARELQHFGKVVAHDPVARTIDIKQSGKTADEHPASVFAHTMVQTKVLADALMRLGQWIAEHGIDGPGRHRAARDLLLNRPPANGAGGSLKHAGEDAVDAGRRLGRALDHTVLAVQGPPGAGKTFTGARMICDLVRDGKKVGVSAVSHKVIRNLLERLVEAAAKESIRARFVRRIKDDEKDDDPNPAITGIRDNSGVLEALRTGAAQVAGGTPWLWAREECHEVVDVLFVDEAGQMSLANVLAIAQAAKSVVLLGDPQQLEQPQQGSHPEGAGVSALDHILKGGQTIPDDRGLFLPETWRLHPHICSFTSEAFYEGRLWSRSGLDRQVLAGCGSYAGAGLRFVPVEHEGNRSASPEEVEAVCAIVSVLTADGARWVDDRGDIHRLGLEDILIVAPYNAQVADLGERLPPRARVGTVDKFQGQEAPVVIYSMTTSTPEDAPRGMEFLYSSHRLNVATSRARCVCVLVGNPRLFEPECQTPRQMRLANAFCRYLEMAKVVSEAGAVVSADHG